MHHRLSLDWNHWEASLIFRRQVSMSASVLVPHKTPAIEHAYVSSSHNHPQNLHSSAAHAWICVEWKYTCASMLSSISPWASTSTAMSRKIWCKSSKLRSSSLTASCRSWISAKVSITCNSGKSQSAEFAAGLGLLNFHKKSSSKIPRKQPGNRLLWMINYAEGISVANYDSLIIRQARWSVRRWFAQGNIRGHRKAHVTSALLKYGLLEDAFTFACLNHAINLISWSFLSCHCVHSSLYNLSAHYKTLTTISLFPKSTPWSLLIKSWAPWRLNKQVL